MLTNIGTFPFTFGQGNIFDNDYCAYWFFQQTA